MSGPGGGFLRLRLFFDYPPPSTPESSQCWLLLDLSRCRVVTDLSSLIRSKFGFSCRARLSLYLQDCLLPPCEGIEVVRDNDSIRVKLEEVSSLRDIDEDGYDVIHSTNKANKRPVRESENEDDSPQRKRKKKREFEMSPSDSLRCKAGTVKKKSKKWKTKSEKTHDSNPQVKCTGVVQKKKQKKKKKEGNKEFEFENTTMNNTTITKRNKSLDATVSSEKAHTPSKEQLENSKKAKSDSSNTSSLSSNNDNPSKQSSSKSPVSLKKNDESQLVAGAATTDTAVEKPLAPKARFDIQSVSNKSTSNSDSDSSKEGVSSNPVNDITETKNHCPQNNISAKPVKKNSPPTCETSDSSDSDSFVIRKPRPELLTGGNQITLGNGDKKSFAVLYGPAPNPKWAERGMGRGFGRGENAFPWRGPRGRGFRGRVRGRGRGDNSHFTFDYSSDSQKQQQLNHTVSNKSIIIENPPETPKDYSTMPLLAAPPQVGQKIAFKLLELTENYTPAVSDYKVIHLQRALTSNFRNLVSFIPLSSSFTEFAVKNVVVNRLPLPSAINLIFCGIKEGKIISYSPASQQLDLEVFSTSRVAKEPGKFDLVYEGAGGAHTVEYAISQDTKITQSWSALIEPRLIVEICSVPAVSVNKENGENVSLPQ